MTGDDCIRSHNINRKARGVRMNYNCKLEKVLINKCIELYKNMIDERSEIDAENSEQDIDYGNPPQYMVIRMYEAVRKTEHFYKRTFVKAWMYKDDVLNSRTQEELGEDDMIRSGMFYNCSTGDFYCDLEKMKAFINIKYGPRYARGYAFDIQSEEDNISLENEDVLWVS